MRSLELKALILRSLQKAMAQRGTMDPVKWLVARMAQPDSSASQQDYDFEQVAGRKLATSLHLQKIRIKDSKGNTVTVVEAPDEATAVTLTAKDLSIEDFLEIPQTSHIFLPANNSGPDVV